jgi:hypothetical protein
MNFANKSLIKINCIRLFCIALNGHKMARGKKRCYLDKGFKKIHLKGGVMVTY